VFEANIDKGDQMFMENAAECLNRILEIETKKETAETSAKYFIIKAQVADINALKTSHVEARRPMALTIVHVLETLYPAIKSADQAEKAQANAPIFFTYMKQFLLRSVSTLFTTSE